MGIMKQRTSRAKTVIGVLLKQHDAVETQKTLANAYEMLRTSKDPEQFKLGKTIVKSKIGKGSKAMFGMEPYVDDVDILLENGNKGIFIAGYHGLGKSSIVGVLAEKYDAEMTRIQVTEMLTEIDLLGSIDIKTGEFIQSEFVKKIQLAIKNPTKKYFLLLDEFTRGRDEALNILYPVLAEKKLFINSVYSDIKALDIPPNMFVFATGNLHDTGQREVGQAEADRYNIIEVDFIKSKPTLKKIIRNKVIIDEEIEAALIETYLKSIDEYNNFRILAMSVRTLVEAVQISNGLINKGFSKEEVYKKAMKLTYYGTSQAMLNPNYKLTYNEIIDKVARNL